jgi:hypothetical protein
MAINSQKLLPPPSSALVKVGKIKTDKKSKDASTGSEDTITAIKNELIKIKDNLEKIHKLTLTSNKLTEKDLEVKRLSAEKLKFAEKEERLEDKGEKKEKDKGGEIIPKMGIFDRINRFITFTFLGWLANKLFKHLPKLLEFSKNIAPVMEFFSSFTANIFKGLVDFIDFGYDTHKKVRDFIGNIGGEDFQKTFDEFSSNLNKFVNLAIIAGIAASGGTDFGLGKGAKPGTPSRPGQGGRPKVTTSGGGGAGRPDIRNPLRSGPRVTTTGGGAAGAPNIRSPLRQKPQITGSGGKVLGKMGGKVFGKIPVIGGLVSFIISVLSGEPVGRAAAKAVGFSIGSALGTFVPVPFVGTILGGMLGDIVGGALYDTLVGNKPEKPEVVAKSKGGKVTTRKGKVVGGPTQRKVRRVVRRVVTPPKSSPINPGKSVGGEEKLKKMFPEPSSGQVGTSMDPYGTTVGTAEKMGDIPFLGPLFNIFGKTLLGDLPNKGDYQKVGMGLGAWINTAISQGMLQGNLVSAFSNGGIIDDIGKSDISGWVEKSVEELIKNKVTEAINELKRNLGLESLSGTGDPVSPGDMDDAVLSESEMDLFQRLILAESGGQGKIGMSLVARSVLNRAGLIQSGKATTGTFSANDSTVTGVIMGRNQYQPIRDGSISRQRTQQQMDAAKEAIKFAQDPDKLRAALKSEGLDDSTISKLLAATGFRTGSAFRDPSQNVNVVRYKDHYFNTAGNTALIIASSQISTKITPVSAEESKLGPGYGTGGQKIAGDLGDYMKSNKSRIPVTGSIHRHPRHPPWSTSGHSRNSLHYQGRAIDFGGWAPSNMNSGGRDEQAPVIKAVIEWNKRNKYTPVQLIHHSPKYRNVGWYQSDHNDHVHVAYKDGGVIGGKNIKSIQTQASYDEGQSVAMFIQPIIIERPIPMNSGNKSITFVGGGVNSNNSKSSLFVG